MTRICLAAFVLLLLFSCEGTSTITVTDGTDMYFMSDSEFAPDGQPSPPNNPPVQPDGGPNAPDMSTAAVCGDGIIEDGETCDPPGTCPTQCDDQDACTVSELTGAAATCDAECIHTPITVCQDDDGCCPPGCNAANDNDCQISCGDGICSGNNGETCVNCPDDCNTRDPVCGNGACEDGENSENCYADCGPATWSDPWLAFEEEVLVLLNNHRAAGSPCPSGPRSEVGPLTMQENLRRASQLHSWDLAYSNYTGHTSCNGRTFTQRASAHGASAGAEILVYGGGSPAVAVASWMGSEGHCNIIMSGNYSTIGVGYAVHNGVHRWAGKLR